MRHTNEQMEEELNAIVDMGGCVKDVAVNHRIYGRMEAELNISSRRKIALFLEDIKHGSSSPLSSITSGYHYHTVSADSRETLDAIEEMLRQRGFLVEERKEDSGINRETETPGRHFILSPRRFSVSLLICLSILYLQYGLEGFRQPLS